MLTPAFEITQDDSFLHFVIKAPFAKITDTEIFVEEFEFRFHSKPYFLRLNLPGKIVEDGKETATYDSDKGTFIIKIPKATPGEQFDGLDLLTKLLTPKCRQDKHQPQIEVLGNDEDKAAEEDDDEEEDFDWHVDQQPYIETDSLLDAPRYGFANQKSGVFKRLQDEVYELVDLKDADSCPASKRRELRMEAEDKKFDPEYYQADFIQDESIEEVMKFEPTWCRECQKLNNREKISDIVEFTEDEKSKMRSLPKKEYIMDESLLTSSYLGLIDIIFAYAYNIRATEGEGNVESGWTISKLSGVFSWLEVFSSVDDVCCTCMRRSLCYPLYRNWNLSMLVLKDTQQIFNLGKLKILQCLLDIHNIFKDSYPRYILNDLYITDYCVWIQSASDKRIKSIAAALQKVNIDKTAVGLDLCALEVESVEDDTEELVEQVFGLSIKEAKDDSDDDDESDEEETTDDFDSSEGSDDDDTDNTDEENEGEDKPEQDKSYVHENKTCSIVDSLDDGMKSMINLDDTSDGNHGNSVDSKSETILKEGSENVKSPVSLNSESIACDQNVDDT